MMGEKRFAKALVAGALILAGLAGCGNQAQDQASQAAKAAPEPTSAQELVSRWEENPNSKNCHMDLDINVSADFLGQKLEMPIKLAFDVADDKSHGTAEMDLSSVGSQKVNTEIYVEKEGDAYSQYSSVENGDKTAWYKATSDDDYFTKQFTAMELLKDAQFAKTDNGYTLTIPATKLLEAMSDSNEMNGMLGNIDDKTVQDALSKAEAVYTFDKDCTLQNVTFEVSYPMGGAQTGDEASSAGKVLVNFTLAYSNYGGIDPASVTVPEDIKKNAVETESASADTDATKTDDNAQKKTDDSAQKTNEQKEAA